MKDDLVRPLILDGAPVFDIGETRRDSDLLIASPFPRFLDAQEPAASNGIRDYVSAWDLLRR